MGCAHPGLPSLHRYCCLRGRPPGRGPGAACRLARVRPRPQAGGRLLGAVSPGWARLRLSGHRHVVVRHRLAGARPPAQRPPGGGWCAVASGWARPAQRPQAGGRVRQTRVRPLRRSGRRPVGRWRVWQARKCPDRALNGRQAGLAEVWRHQSACRVRRASILSDLLGFVARLRVPSAAWCQSTSDWALSLANRRPSAAKPSRAAPEVAACLAPPTGLRSPTKAGPLPGLRWGPAPRGRPTLICTSGTGRTVKGGRRPSRSDATEGSALDGPTRPAILTNRAAPGFAAHRTPGHSHPRPPRAISRGGSVGAPCRR